MNVLEKLLAERAEIYARTDELRATINGHEGEIDMFMARAAGLDVAINLLEAEQPPAGERLGLATPRAPRMDIAAAVLAKLAAGPLTLGQLAEAIGRKPGQIQAALDRLGSKAYRANDGIYFVAQAAADERVEQAAE